MRILKWHEIMMNPVEREFISWTVLHVQFRKPVIMCLFWIFPLENGQEAAGSVPQGISDLWLNAGHILPMINNCDVTNLCFGNIRWHRYQTRSLESAFTRPRETHCCWLTVIHIHKKYVTDTQVITEILW